MSTWSRILTLLVIGAIIVLVVTHPAGFATDALAGGNVLNNTLALESGQGVQGGTHGNFAFGGSTVSV